MVLTTYPTRTYNHSAGKPHISKQKNDNGTIPAIVIPNRIGGVTVSVLSSNSINCGFEQHVYQQNVASFN
jgi:hypothetical protein